MDNKQRRDAGLAYVTDKALLEEQAQCRKILQRLNFMERSDFEGIMEVAKANPRSLSLIRLFILITASILK